MTETTPSFEQIAVNSTIDDEFDERILTEHRSIPPDVREKALVRDGHRCRIDGCRGTEQSDSTQLVVQRVTEHPRDCAPDDVENVTTYCLHCARWVAQMPSRDDLPPVLRDRLDGADLDTDHVEILQYLHENGPAQTSEVTEAVDRTNPTSVRRVIYDLMSRDVSDEDVSGRLVAKDRLAETYGLFWQIPEKREARGVIPLRPHTRRTRILDAVVSRLLEVLNGRVDDPREVAAAVVDRKSNQTYNMQKRAAAFQFPFENWAETKRSRHDDAAVIEAISILAGATDNVSRRRVAAPLVEVLNDNDEHELATVLQRSLLEDRDRPFDALASHSAENPSTNQPASETSSERTELQVFGDADADTRADTQTTGETTRRSPHSEDQDT